MERLGVLRMLSAACTNELVSLSRGPDGVLSEEEIMALVMRAAKQRKDSIEQFEKGGRADLADAEKKELAVLEEMLPTQMTADEITAAVQAKATEMGVVDKTGANQLMGALMKDLKGKADGTLVKAAVDGMFA
jgi:uncharacterized protein YqeY